MRSLLAAIPVIVTATAVPQSEPPRGAPEHLSADLDRTHNNSTAALDVPLASSRISTRERIRALLLDDFARRLTYPPLAQQHGWNGKVLLSVTVDQKGLLTRVHLVQSSGYEILDESALTTMRQIELIADAQQWLDGNDMELELPVIYRLHD